MHILYNVLIGIGINGFALYALTKFIDGITYTGGIKTFVVAGIILGIINLILKPILKIVSFPAIILTGGLFLILINAAMLWFLSYFLEILQFRDVALTFPNFSSYVIGAIVLGILNWILNLFFKA